MQRKLAPVFPANSCSIRMPDTIPTQDICNGDSDDGQRRRQHLINFAHSHWGFKNWSWGVTKQELDFVDSSGGKYCAGVVAFVNVTVKSMEIHREDIGYATCVSTQKGSAIFQARKCAVTNALRETLLSFGGTFATALAEMLECQRPAEPARNQPDGQENNQNAANEPIEPKNDAKTIRKEPPEVAVRSPIKIVEHQHKAIVPVAKAQPMPNAVPPQPAKVAYQHRPPPPPVQQGAPLVRPNANEAPPTAEATSDEERRAERKRRQRQAQEEFRVKLLQKMAHDPDGAGEGSDSVDHLIMEIHTQELVAPSSGKRKSADDRQQASKRQH